MDDYYESLIVRAELMSPVALDRWQPLDGILGATIIEDPELRQRDRLVRRWRRGVRKYGRAGTLRYFHEQGWEVPDRLHFMPLAVWGHGENHSLWVYRSSWAIPGEYEHDLVHLAKRVDFEQVDRYVKTRHKRVYTAKGEFASKYIPLQTVVTDALTWYVRGNYDDLQEMLPLVRSIAKKRRRGYGLVRRWTVERTEHDLSVFSPDGALMRPVPINLLNKLGINGEFQREFTTYRPPYWDGRYATLCAVSGTREAT